MFQVSSSFNHFKIWWSRTVQGLWSGFSVAVKEKVIWSKIVGASTLCWIIINQWRLQTEGSFRRKSLLNPAVRRKGSRLVVVRAPWAGLQASVLWSWFHSVYFVSVFPLLRGLLEGLHITCLDLGTYTGVFSL